MALEVRSRRIAMPSLDGLVAGPKDPAYKPRVVDAIAPSAAEHNREELRDLIHEPVVIPARSVPLEDRELGVVAAARLAVAESFAELVDGAAAGGEQPLHRELGRGLEPEAAAAVITGSAIAGTQSRQVEIGDRRRGEKRSFHFEHSTIGEERADLRENLRPNAKRLHRSRRSPVVRHPVIIA
jgi:hypothetical protein